MSGFFCLRMQSTSGHVVGTIGGIDNETWKEIYRSGKAD